ncbi:amidohydrolase family protein [Chloroflexota bacterium]
MSNSRQMIDMFCHVNPEKYVKGLYSKSPQRNLALDDDAHYNIELRLRMLDKYEGMSQVLTMPSSILDLELAKVANDGLAELVAKYPKRFVAAAGCLPMNNMDAALREAQRAIETLKLKGVVITSPCNEKPLDSPEFLPLYEMMEKYDLPIWIHPTRSPDTPDYKGESESKYRIYSGVGWPVETTNAMMRLVLGGVMEKYPSLKIITHHCGGMVPFYAWRLGGAGGWEEVEGGSGKRDKLNRPREEYFKSFYGDTAVYTTPALMCGYAFFGAEHLLFASDFPAGGAERRLEYAVTTVEQMDIPDSEKDKIFEGNARRLLHL